MWHRKAWAGLVIRLAGIIVLGVSAEAVRFLSMHAGATPIARPASDYALALIAFVCASAGSAMLFFGGHLFDRVEVAGRWRRLTPGR